MRTKSDPTAPQLPGTTEVYNDDLDQAIHDVWHNRIRLAELKADEAKTKETLMMEMKKVGKDLVVKYIDGSRFVVELITKEQRLKFKIKN